MKIITTEDIVKESMVHCKTATRDGYQAIQSFREGAEWVNNQLSKLKTLEQWGWKISKELVMECKVLAGGFQMNYQVFRDESDVHFWRQSNDGRWWSLPEGCDSFDHGKELCQNDCDKRISKFFV